jgi:hypothetical protein
MPDATVVSIKRLENAEMYNAYFEVRQAVGTSPPLPVLTGQVSSLPPY